MSAKDMFEELGMYPSSYNDNLFDETIFEYSNNKKTENVKFYLTSKFYKASSENGFSLLIDINLDNAIHQQIKELGWYE